MNTNRSRGVPPRSAKQDSRRTSAVYLPSNPLKLTVFSEVLAA